ncbi:PREDICTED: protein FLX-like 4 [Nelumbo nucifera]|uniref:Protein FLX-like 4 n=1 Tax=Nelumbo nucifera TaxID=4432 RepID=A0A1U8AQ96_NELNU|nr:PREDICTED: protein FLX-like 4 [Nelumbo nucifera]XP_010268402.1 PREDICTED: protein FLX-like 4 [Nelumbo nucifera]XP_019054663.1 PREDICTED: protein FLX-like 4 [Nelumbo nucifera]
MAARGHIPFEGRPIQAPGMMRHGPFPGLGPPAGQRVLEPLPPELLENKLAVQAAEMERLARENHRLADTHVTLRQELVATQQEMQRLQAHIGSLKTESDIQIRVLLEKIAKMEAEVRVGESIKKDLQQAHMEAQSLITARQELSAQIQQTTQELQKTHAEVKKLPEMHEKLDSLRQEHQRLRAAFEYEKGLNMEQVEQMQAMDRNLVSMAREVEKLRAEVLSAENRARAPNPYGGYYGTADPSYPPPSVQGGGIYIDGYGRPQVQMDGVVAGEGINLYRNANAAAASGGGATGTASATPPPAVAGSGSVATGANEVPVAAAGTVASGVGSGGWGGSYDPTRGALTSVARR